MDKKTQKAIINSITAKKSAYMGSSAFSSFKTQGEKVVSAVDQKYRIGEQYTKSGFYLATHTAQYEAITETFTQVYAGANPLWIFDTKKLGGEDFALKAQRFLNCIWERMGRNNEGGTQQWLELTRDVPLWSMGVGYVDWHTEGQIVEAPKIAHGEYSAGIEWVQEYQKILDEPCIKRVHPCNWFGEWNTNNPRWEGIIERWTLSEAYGALKSKTFIPEHIKALIEELRKGGNDGDEYFYKEIDSDTDTESKKCDIIKYWGKINDVKGLENDANEYHIICDSKRIYKIERSLIPGYRPIKRVLSNPRNDCPWGRSLLAPNLTHTKILNLSTNLMIDDVIQRMQMPWAVWADKLENMDELANPQGVGGFAFMTPDATPNHVPQMMGGRQSGVLSDLERVTNVINTDRQRNGDTDQNMGIKGKGDETATGRMLLKNADSRRTRAAIITMANTGLIPIGKHTNLLGLRNIPEQERLNMSYDGEPLQVSNEDMVQIWNNNLVEIHDSILKPLDEEAQKKIDYLGLVQQTLLEDPRGLDKLIPLFKDIGRDMGINNVDRYMSDPVPPSVQTQPPGEVLSNNIPQVENAALPGGNTEAELMQPPLNEVPVQ